MAAKTLDSRVVRLIPALPAFFFAFAYIGLPVLLLVEGSLGKSISGFERGFSALLSLTVRSVAIATIPAVLATTVCITASMLGVFHMGFSWFYRAWLLVMLFTNPVFLVFGFSILLAETPAVPAVLLASTYILMPLCGHILQAAVDEFDPAQARTARALGASPLFVVWHHILPFVRQQMLASVLLSVLYALGFYLTPVFVGLGTVVTLGTVIYDAANSVGDWTAACQLCVVAISVQVLITAIWVVASRCLTLATMRTEG